MLTIALCFRWTMGEGEGVGVGVDVGEGEGEKRVYAG